MTHCFPHCRAIFLHCKLLETKVSLDRSVRICSHCSGLRNTIVSMKRSDGVPKGGRERTGRRPFGGPGNRTRGGRSGLPKRSGTYKGRHGTEERASEEREFAVREADSEH